MPFWNLPSNLLVNEPIPSSTFSVPTLGHFRPSNNIDDYMSPPISRHAVPWTHSCPMTWQCPQEGPGPASYTRKQTLVLGPPGPYSQRPCGPALLTSGQAQVHGPQPCRHTNSRLPNALQQEALGHGSAHWWADTSPRTSCTRTTVAPKPALSEPNQYTSKLASSLEYLGPGSAHQKDMPAQGLLGPLSQWLAVSSLSTNRLTPDLYPQGPVARDSSMSFCLSLRWYWPCHTPGFHS